MPGIHFRNLSATVQVASGTLALMHLNRSDKQPTTGKPISALPNADSSPRIASAWPQQGQNLTAARQHSLPGRHASASQACQRPLSPAHRVIAEQNRGELAHLQGDMVALRDCVLSTSKMSSRHAGHSFMSGQSSSRQGGHAETRHHVQVHLDCSPLAERLTGENSPSSLHKDGDLHACVQKLVQRQDQIVGALAAIQVGCLQCPESLDASYLSAGLRFMSAAHAVAVPAGHKHASIALGIYAYMHIQVVSSAANADVVMPCAGCHISAHRLQQRPTTGRQHV